MGIGPESRGRLEALRGLAGSLGVEPSAADLEAVLGFLDGILPELARLEGLLAPEDGPSWELDGDGAS